MDEAPEYGIAFKNDSERAKKLREIVVKISQIDSLIAQAAEFERQKSPYFAWDILENASRIDSADPVCATCAGGFRLRKSAKPRQGCGEQKRICSGA